MKNLMIVLSVFILFGCASTTVIRTIPNGAKVKEGDELKGITPYEYWDRAISGVTTTFTLQKEGYKDKTITIKKNVFYIHRFFFPPILAWPWIFGYDPVSYFELEKSEQPNQGTGSTFSNQFKITNPNAHDSSNSETQSNSANYLQSLNNLKELRRLKDEGLLTDEEYEQKKKMIMEIISQ